MWGIAEAVPLPAFSRRESVNKSDRWPEKWAMRTRDSTFPGKIILWTLEMSATQRTASAGVRAKSGAWSVERNTEHSASPKPTEPFPKVV